MVQRQSSRTACLLLLYTSKLGTNIFYTIRLNKQLLRQTASHRVNEKVYTGFSSHLCNGNEISASRDQNYLIYNPLMRQQRNIQSNAHIDTGLLNPDQGKIACNQFLDLQFAQHQSFQ